MTFLIRFLTQQEYSHDSLFTVQVSKKVVVTEGRFGTQDISQQRQTQSARLQQSNIQKQGKKEYQEANTKE